MVKAPDYPPTLVAGPPCGGKSTYARTHARPGETVVDFDQIAAEVSGETYPSDPRALAKAAAVWRERLPGAGWVVWTAPRRAERGRFRAQYGAAVVVVLASPEVCLARARETRPAAWERFVREWWTAWEPSRSGNETVIRTG